MYVCILLYFSGGFPVVFHIKGLLVPSCVCMYFALFFWKVFPVVLHIRGLLVLSFVCMYFALFFFEEVFQ